MTFIPIIIYAVAVVLAFFFAIPVIINLWIKWDRWLDRKMFKNG